MPWKEYYDMGRIEQLRNSGRELLGKHLFITVKRDGQNIPVYTNPNTDFIGIGSHHKSVADTDMQSRVKACPEWPKVVEFMEEHQDHVVYFEHIMGGGDKYHKTPTRIEKPKKHSHLVLIDIWSHSQNKYLSYNYCYQQAHKYRIPIVDLLDAVDPMSMEELWDIRNLWLNWCKKHYREGIVIKDYYSKYQVFCKEKIDLPKRPKVPKVKDNRLQLPPMPVDKIFSAIDQAFEEVRRSGGDIKDVSVTMPIVARHIATQAREHDYAMVRNPFSYYQEALKNEM